MVIIIITQRHARYNRLCCELRGTGLVSPVSETFQSVIIMFSSQKYLLTST